MIKQIFANIITLVNNSPLAKLTYRGNILHYKISVKES